MSSKPSTSSTPVAHNALPPPSSASAARSSRIAPHSHIKGLGLNPDTTASADGAGFVGQTKAREVRTPWGLSDTFLIIRIDLILHHRRVVS